MSIIRRFLELSLPLKMITAAIAGAIAGPGLLAFLSEYAAYHYALAVGVRPPVEGIPYLSATVALASLVLALCASFIFLTTRWTFGWIGAQLVDAVRMIASLLDVGLQAYRDKGGRLFKRLSLSEAINAIKELSFAQISGLTGALSFGVWLLATKTMAGRAEDPTVVGFALAFYISVAIFSLWHRGFAWFVAIVAVICFYAFSFWMLFDSERHGIFLSGIGYGGGIPVVVEYENDRSKEHIRLALRTATALLSQPSETGEFVEIPIERVRRIVYQQRVLGREAKVENSSGKREEGQER